MEPGSRGHLMVSLLLPLNLLPMSVNCALSSPLLFLRARMTSPVLQAVNQKLCCGPAVARENCFAPL